MADPFFYLFYLLPLLPELHSHRIQSYGDVFNAIHLYLRYEEVLLVVEDILEEEAIVA
jgi:hypothetical protein